jgi:anaerobic magnesium-protoporphyrin IX monomethyl ester cyclase
MTVELLTKMKQAGCRHLGWGLESGCQDVLNLMRKRFYTIDLAKEVIKRTHDCGMSQSICLIVGFPGETESMFQETLQFAGDFRKYFLNVYASTMLILPNTTVYNEYQQFGLDLKNAREYQKWQSADGSNTYEIREKRIAILKSVLAENAVAVDSEPSSPSD